MKLKAGKALIYNVKKKIIRKNGLDTIHNLGKRKEATNIICVIVVKVTEGKKSNKGQQYKDDKKGDLRS